MEPLRAGDPRQVGPYRLRGRLGGGGMGQVFLGRSRGGRPVAVKVVRSELAHDEGFRRRFAIEVEAARLVGGFYTAQVVDADTDADQPWLATDYIPGPSLQQAVAAHGPLPPAAVGVLGAGLAEGLTAIHQCKLVHRDLKPGNVILAANGPRVIDFGVARALEITSHTATGAVIGTPAFMSPEQIRSDEVGPASDVFSLGAVLVFAASGRGPFGDGHHHTIMYRILHDDPDLSGLPSDLTDLVGACLAKTPQNRPSLNELLDQLTAPAESATRWLTSEVTTMITRLEQARADASISLDQIEEARNPEQATKVDGNAERMAVAFIELGWLEKTAGNLEEARTLFQRAVETGNPWQQAKALICLGCLEHDDAGDVEQARGFWKRAAESGQPGIAPQAMVNLASLEKTAGNLGEARKLYRQASETDDRDAAAQALNGWADLERNAGNPDQARKLHRQAIEVGGDLGWIAVAFIELGWLEKTAGNLEEARTLFQRAVETGNPWQQAKALICLGCLEHDDAGDVEQARGFWKRAAESGQPGIAPQAMVNLASLEKTAGNLGEARKLYRQASETDDRDAAAQALNGWADLERNAGNPDQARKLYRQILDGKQPPAEPGK
ncbi:serine/threonine-protein kinase [Nonomuraea fuscirosea]|uniref:serine/threonine-protein kinase n=1 Tax=Nonomuraea fuscirosea TaxID=1291556 RepID=UPI002DDB8304|nr:serine/threonine-protein kinase [Nonomuraea fuscirosea]WSA50196.1 serine/threonine-protein kinase [Nonomuraea fuscirosea]